ncbi:MULTISPECIES: energy-coupling factor transporter transmembrane component T family protein [Comamonas]|uniref:energy-coupling factor transporter transmembrane component T family protein n=1 Tax=Comamonas TaxID=283 RepID=UPI00050E9F65|nr:MULTISPECIES: energy-coupling factor transporter transmembrane protein EcfT [Comamonas]KGG91832.1 ABC transporter permease [Comamonas thiooxydans]KGG95339.1 ABC transporter permease [Comamonas thiooxydans]KGH07911.1 ABC transporter permease [Comamonas thiooxydans]KGH15440.1 ABC transporter permease [Comamonas thiooxydans]TZG07180.1 energy-coupling factor transporter transmembrane protein EcfT [Comamonas thiooxydans]
MGSLYSEVATWLHRWSAGLKLLLLAVFGTLLFLIANPWALACCGVACLVLWISLGEATQVARRLMRSVIVAALLVAGFHAFMGNPLLAAVSSLRLICASTLGIALTITTRPSDLVEVLEWLLAPLARLGIPTERVAMQLALMLRFTEHFFVQWTKLDEAYRLRTGKSGGLRLIAPLTIHMLQATRRVADALWARLGF